MENIAKYESKRTSLTCVAVDGIYTVSAFGLLPNGELNDDHEMFWDTYTDKNDAVKVYNKLRLVLSTCDIRKHYTTSAVLKSYALEALKGA